MPRIDLFIDRLFSESGSELVLETGSGAFVKTDTGRTPLIKQSLTTPQIVGAFAEIVPSDLRHEFPPNEGRTSFAYVAPAGAVLVQFEVHGNRARAVVTPGASVDGSADEETMVLASSGDFDLGQDAASPSGLETADEVQEVDVEERAVAPADYTPAPMTPVHGSAAVLQRPGSLPTPAIGSARVPSRSLAAAAAAATSLAAQARILPPATARGAQAVPARPRPPVARPADPRQAIDELFALMVERGASDLHLTSGQPPSLRIDGELVPLEGYAPPASAELKAMLWTVAPGEAQSEWAARKDAGFAHETTDARFRGHLFADRRGIAAVVRRIPRAIPPADELGLPPAALELAMLERGLVLVTGAAGAGKSTTLAALVDHINRQRAAHVLTIEEPIEFLHQGQKALVRQREVGTHVGSFREALRAALREDPDVVVVSALPDVETIALALELAEHGRLVLAAVHTGTAVATVDRLVEQFPDGQKAQARAMLAESLRGVVSQTLCRRIGGGRVPAFEVLLCPSGVSTLIRDGKTFQLPSLMQTGRTAGMIALNDSLFELVRRKVVDPLEALRRSPARGELRAMLERAGFRGEAS